MLEEKASNQIEFAELELKISQQYQSLSKRLQQVAKFILENQKTVAFETATVLSVQSKIPPSTFIRFANAFGFDGFNDIKKIFRTHLLTETSNYNERAKLAHIGEDYKIDDFSPKDLLKAFCDANSAAMEHLYADSQSEKLEQAVEMLQQADHIYVVGLGRSFSVSSYFAYALQHLNRRAFLVNGLGGMLKEQLSTIQKDDILVMISFSPYSKDSLSLMESAKKVGAKQLTITDSPLSPLATGCDLCFTVKEGKVDAFRSHAATLCLVQTLAVSMAYNDKT